MIREIVYVSYLLGIYSRSKKNKYIWYSEGSKHVYITCMTEKLTMNTYATGCCDITYQSSSIDGFFTCPVNSRISCPQ